MGSRSCKTTGGRQIFRAGLLFIILLFFWLFPIRAGAASHVICIDPGHGGENLGAEYLGAELSPELEGCTEKHLNLITALAMRDRLLQYEDVEVVMTRTDDTELSLGDRAVIASTHGAEFLFSIHYNASESMRLFGSEVFISAFGDNYVKGMQFGQIETKALEGLGLLDRGVKTRISDKTGEDYYGIIKRSAEEGIPAAIIEHCHLDNPQDYPFYNTEEKLKTFGKLDADCVARYLGLSSEILGIDHSDRVLADIPRPASPVWQDRTDPDFCMTELLEEDKENRRVLVEVSAHDADGPILYYTVSFDGGETESAYQIWPKGKDTMRLSLEVPYGIVPNLVIKVYNRFDLDTESQPIQLSSVAKKEETDVSAESSDSVPEGTDTDEEPSSQSGNTDAPEQEGASTVIEGSDEAEALLAEQGTGAEPDRFTGQEFLKKEEPAKKENDSFLYFLESSLVVVFLLFTLFLIFLLVEHRIKRKKRRRNVKNRRLREMDREFEL